MITTTTESLRQRARTKIVATVGPACWSTEMLAKLIAAGADVFRLNMAHSTIEEHTRTVEKLRELSNNARPVAILVDLAGPKIRLGKLPDDQIECEEGATYQFVRGSASAGPNELTSNYEKLIDDLRKDDNVMLADGTVAMVVTDSQEDIVKLKCVQGGLIRTKQGINLPGAKVSLPAMTERDFECAKWAASVEADYVSLSFVRSANEIKQLKEFLKEHGSEAPVVAKIEKPEAMLNLESIVTATDAVMVARGDLGVEIDVAKVPVAQKRIIATCNRLQRPVIVATQMLDSMQEATRPTRAEVTDVANAILDGADACMLSGETAIGNHPTLVVETMNRIMLETEELLPDKPSRPPQKGGPTATHPITESVVYGAAKIAEHLSASMVVVATRSGATALTKSNQRDFIPTIAVSSSAAVLRRTCLFWGVTPLPNAPIEDSKALTDFVIRWGKEDGLVKSGDCVVIVAGSGVREGAHNVVAVHTVD